MEICNDCVYFGKQKKTHFYICTYPWAKLYRVPSPHGKTRKACSFFEFKVKHAKSSKVQIYRSPFTPTENTRLLEDYRDKYLGEEIWMIGPGWSLDEYPDNFFDDKVSIIISTAFMAFPRSTYIFSGHAGSVDWIVENSPESLKKCILTVLPVDYGWDGCWPDRYGDVPIWMRIRHAVHTPVSKIVADCREMAAAIMEKRSTIYTPCWSGANTAVIAAIVLGADKVTMVGCSTVPLKYHSHALRAGITDIFYPDERHLFPQEELEGKTEMQRIWRKGTSLLAELFKPYGIEIRKYYYKTGYEEAESLSDFDDLIEWPPILTEKEHKKRLKMKIRREKKLKERRR